MLEAKFWFSAHSPRKQGRKAGLAGGVTKIWNFNICHKSDTQYNLALVTFLFYAIFLLGVPQGP